MNMCFNNHFYRISAMSFFVLIFICSFCLMAQKPISNGLNMEMVNDTLFVVYGDTVVVNGSQAISAEKKDTMRVFFLYSDVSDNGGLFDYSVKWCGGYIVVDAFGDVEYLDERKKRFNDNIKIWDFKLNL